MSPKIILEGPHIVRAWRLRRLWAVVLWRTIDLQAERDQAFSRADHERAKALTDRIERARNIQDKLWALRSDLEKDLTKSFKQIPQ